MVFVVTSGQESSSFSIACCSESIVASDVCSTHDTLIDEGRFNGQEKKVFPSRIRDLKKELIWWLVVPVHGMKIFQRGDTYIAPKGAFFDGHVRVIGNFITPPETHFWGKLEVGGRLELGPGSSVANQIMAQSAIIGPRVKVQGPLIVLENVVVCDNSLLHSIQAGGNVLIRPGVTVGDVKSDETITVYGKIQSGQLLGRNVKIFGN